MQGELHILRDKVDIATNRAEDATLNGLISVMFEAGIVFEDERKKELTTHLEQNDGRRQWRLTRFRSLIESRDKEQSIVHQDRTAKLLEILHEVSKDPQDKERLFRFLAISIPFEVFGTSLPAYARVFSEEEQLRLISVSLTVVDKADESLRPEMLFRLVTGFEGRMKAHFPAVVVRSLRLLVADLNRESKDSNHHEVTFARIAMISPQAALVALGHVAVERPEVALALQNALAKAKIIQNPTIRFFVTPLPWPEPPCPPIEDFSRWDVDQWRTWLGQSRRAVEVFTTDVELDKELLAQVVHGHWVQ